MEGGIVDGSWGTNRIAVRARLLGKSIEPIVEPMQRANPKFWFWLSQIFPIV